MNKLNTDYCDFVIQENKNLSLSHKDINIFCLKFTGCSENEQ